MEILISRHAKRRIKLYKIDLEDIYASINTFFSKNFVFDEVTNIITDEFIDKYKYPLKVVLKQEKNDIFVVITAYPLKKGLKDESIL